MSTAPPLALHSAEANPGRSDSAVALAEWAAIDLPHDVRLAVSVAMPDSPLAELGAVELYVVREGRTASVSGLDAIFGELPLREFEGHDSSALSVQLIQSTESKHLVALSLAAIWGEDVRTVRFHTALWRIAVASPPAMERVWAGRGDSYLLVLDACTLGVRVDYRAHGPDAVLRHCTAVSNVSPDGQRRSDCALRSGFTRCSDQLISW